MITTCIDNVCVNIETRDQKSVKIPPALKDLWVSLRQEEQLNDKEAWIILSAGLLMFNHADKIDRKVYIHAARTADRIGQLLPKGALAEMRKAFEAEDKAIGTILKSPKLKRDTQPKPSPQRQRVVDERD